MVAAALRRVEKCLGQLYSHKQHLLLENLPTHAEVGSYERHHLHERLFEHLATCEAIQIKLGEVALERLREAERLGVAAVVADDLKHMGLCSGLLGEGGETSYEACDRAREALKRIGEEDNASLLLVLLLVKHSTSWVAKTISEEVPELSFLGKLAEDEEAHAHILSNILSLHLSQDRESEYVEAVQRNAALPRLASALGDDAVERLAPLLGEGSGEAQLELGRQKITFMHEDMFVSRVNLLRKTGFSLLASQKIAEAVGGSVKAGVGC